MNRVLPELGVIFPTKDIGADQKSLLEYAPRVEALGLGFIAAYDHVIGVDEAHHNLTEGDTGCIFTSETNVHEPLVLFGAMAVLTKRIKLITGCLVAPQRQTGLVAKQVAEVDILSGGRLILGVCGGWNEGEFRALGADFLGRGRRLEEQVGLLGRLWTERGIDHENGVEHFDKAGIKPLPERSIPLWIGGLSLRAIERAVRISDGWIPMGRIDKAMEDRLASFWSFVEQYGKENMEVLGRINPWEESFESCAEEYEKWVEHGVTHLAIGSSHDCFTNTDQYFDDLERFLDYLKSQVG